MSSKKDKLIDNALKFVSKGQMDKAIKEYQQVVAIDPADHRQRQKLAELLVRVNHKEEAVAEYETIAKHYTNSYFFLKAIAVYKQIQKLMPDDINTNFSLASLYSKQGMTVNAIVEYTTVANHYKKIGQPKETLKVLQIMQETDPDNPDIRLKLAEACVSAGEVDRGYMEFAALALHHRKSGDAESFATVAERVRTLFPDRQDFTLQVTKAQLDSGDTARAIPHLREIVAEEKTNRRAWNLLIEAYQKIGETAERNEALKAVADIFDEELAPAEEAVKALIAENDSAGALKLLKEYESRFIAKGAIKSLETLYKALSSQAPGNPDVISGLKGAYESAGETEKAESLAEAAPEPEPEESREEEPEEPSPEEEATAAEEIAEPSPAVDESAAWEEEIDLSLLDEGTSDLYSVSPPGEETDDTSQLEAEETSGRDVDYSEEQPEDLSPPEEDGFSEVELEIGDTDLSRAEWLEEPASTEEEMDWGSLPEEEESAEWSGLEQSEEELPEVDLKTALIDVLDEAERVSREAELAAASQGTAMAEDETTALPPAEAVPERDEEPPPAGRRRKKYDIDGQFSEFKKGVDQQLDKEDTETHYNLGIAYKEMGLLDDAIGEFRTAAVDPSRTAVCMTLEGICHREKGDMSSAEEVFSEALTLERLNLEERLSLMYELAFLFETAGRREDAAKKYGEVQAMNPGFRDAAEKVARLLGTAPVDAELLELEVEEFDP